MGYLRELCGGTGMGRPPQAGGIRSARPGACYRSVMPGQPRILIVGAGIAGSALAASLERFGITPRRGGMGKASLSRGLALMLTSNAALALRRVGLDRAVTDQGLALERIIHADPSGTPVEIGRPSAGRMTDTRPTSASRAAAGLLALPARHAGRFATQRRSRRCTRRRRNRKWNSRTGGTPVRSGGGGRRHPLHHAQPHLPAPRARVPVVLPRGGQSWSARIAIRSSGSAPPPAASWVASR